MKNLFISFSGGESSAYMTQLILNSDLRLRYGQVIVLFANTGEENEQTLEFVDRCDKHFGFGVVWVEAVMHHNTRKGATHRVVDFNTASRDGQPFEETIVKYGIPNKRYPHCTRELKLNPMYDYLRSIGWKKGTYDIAIGIRNDEIDRMSRKRKEKNIVYPLIEWAPTTKPNVNTWWAKQPFRLGLKGYQGNCKWCWKKSFRKHYTLIQESPEAYDFPRWMEFLYGTRDDDFKDGAMIGKTTSFFREGKSVVTLFAEAAQLDSTFIPAADDSAVFDPELDIGAGCEESCEVFADEDDNDP